MIEVDHLSKYYGPVTAIRDLSFNVAQGEVLGFLGPNGAGKTTTMLVWLTHHIRVPLLILVTSGICLKRMYC